MRAKLAAIFCAVFRHSHLLTNCMGYKYCARCGTQIGDTLAGPAIPTGPGQYYLLGQRCKCDSCRASFDTLTWIDRFLCPRPEWPT